MNNAQRIARGLPVRGRGRPLGSRSKKTIVQEEIAARPAVDRLAELLAESLARFKSMLEHDRSTDPI